jgi:hypothetical protein
MIMPETGLPNSAKLIMTWDIAPNREQEYFEFVVRDFIPGIQTLGFEIQEAWATAYGERPQIQVGATMPTAERIRSAMESNEWINLHQQLMEVVLHYEEKIVPTRTRFQF